MALTAGTCLGHYEIVSPLGAGGMGEVYLARDKKLHRQVAIKVLHSDRSADLAAQRRFEQEARAVAALAHPNILAIHYFDTHHDLHYAVTELLEGETLRDRITRSRLPWAETARIGAAIADGLAAAHEKGIIHRDLKPANIFLTSDGQVKILDFGLAHVSHDLTAAPEKSTELKTAPHAVMGTVGYMSPEQLSGNPVDRTTDIFALGCILHEMIEGRHPFARPSATAIMAAVLRDEPPELTPEAAPSPLSQLIRRCLEKQPRQRPRDAREIASDLRSLLTSPQTVAPPKAAPANSRRAMIVTASAVLAILVVAAALVVRSRETQLAPQEIRSILVVPFENASTDSAAEYLSDGIAEGLINTLAKLPDVRIVARTTAFQYKGKILDLQQIGRELGVDAVLTGRVASHANNLTVQADLMGTRAGNALWGDRFHQRNTDVLKIEQQIVSQISDALRFQLEPAQQGRVSRPATTNPEAYKLYLQGRFYWNKRNSEAITRSTRLFEQAVALDPQFALAYSGLADAYILLGIFNPGLAEFGRTRSREAVEAALRLDPALAEAHSSLGLLEANQFRWTPAEKAFKRALELNPNHANALLWYSLLFLGRNEFDQSMAMIRRAEEVDPLSPIILSNLAQRLNIKGDHAAALEQANKAVEVEPNYLEPYMQVGLAYEGLGQPEKAIAAYRKAAALDGGAGGREVSLVRATVLSGDLNEAVRLARLLEDRANRREIFHWQVGFAYAAIGDRDKAIDWLNRAFEAREPALRNQIRTAIVKSLWGDPRYEELLSRIERGF